MVGSSKVFLITVSNLAEEKVFRDGQKSASVGMGEFSRQNRDGSYGMEK